MGTESAPEKGLVAALESLRRISKNAELLHRLSCVRLSLAGCRISDVAEWMGVHPRTVARWNAAYRADGVDALRVKPRPGRPPRLTREQWNALRTDFANGPAVLGYHRDDWDGRLLAAHIAGRYQVRISLRQCQRLLRRLRGAASSAPLGDGLDEVADTGAYARGRRPDGEASANDEDLDTDESFDLGTLDSRIDGPPPQPSR